VRCGRCGSAFDALTRLSDTIPPATAEVVPVALVLQSDGVRTDEIASETPVLVVDESAATVAITLEGERVRIEEPPLERIETASLEGTDEGVALRDIPESVLLDELDSDKDIEALVQRLQRDLEAEALERPEVLEPLEAAPFELPSAESLADVDLAEWLEAPSEAQPELPSELLSELQSELPSEASSEVLSQASSEALSELPLEVLSELLAAESPEPHADHPMAPDSMAAVAALQAGKDEFPDVALSRDEAGTPAAPRPSPQIATPPPAPVRPVPGPSVPATPTTTAEEMPIAARRWPSPPIELEAETDVARSPWRTAAWAAGSLVLALVLAAQVVHHFRFDLLRDARLGPPLRDVYARAGIELPPAWDLAAFELNQWSSDDSRSGSLVVRASLRNSASFAQPQPILRLELEDRHGVTIESRDFEPAEYLKDPSQASRLLAAGASSEAELELANPGAEAVGYRLDVCLRESDAQLRCARGPG
jgi:hypothetical protein